MKQLLVTGSSGLIGSEIVTYFDAKGWQVAGVDNKLIVRGDEMTGMTGVGKSSFVARSNASR